MLVNLGKLLDENLPADAVAMIDCLDFDHPRVYTHRDIDRLADACARGLRQRGLVQGDTVALMSLNRAEYVIAYLAIMRSEEHTTELQPLMRNSYDVFCM